MGSLVAGSPALFKDVLLSSCSVALVYGFGPRGEKMASEAPGSAATFQLGWKKSEGEGQKPRAFCLSEFAFVYGVRGGG